MGTAQLVPVILAGPPAPNVDLPGQDPRTFAGQINATVLLLLNSGCKPEQIRYESRDPNMEALRAHFKDRLNEHAPTYGGTPRPFGAAMIRESWNTVLNEAKARMAAVTEIKIPGGTMEQAADTAYPQHSPATPSADDRLPPR